MRLHRVLFVDDEPRVLESVRRTLRGAYHVETAVGAALAVALIRASPPFSVIVSDLRMPGADGITFLAAVRQASPDSVRMLLTGNADLDSAIKAVNDGQVFRFLRKPCPTDQLIQALQAATKQYDLVIAERELLEGTLQGTVKALVDVLALISPLAFARGVRVKECVGAFADRFGIPNRWQFEVAAMLSQIGAVALPVGIAEKIYFGRALTDDEAEVANEVPVAAAAVVGNVPRLEAVREILEQQQRDFTPALVTTVGPSRHEIALGARILRIAFDFDVLVTQGVLVTEALRVMGAREGAYDPDVLHDFSLWQGHELAVKQTRDFTLAELKVGMVLATDVVTVQGVLLIARGQEVTPRVKKLIAQYWCNQPIQGAVRIFAAEDHPHAPAALGAVLASPVA